MLSLLRLCGTLYVLSATWCVFQPDLAAGFLGYTLDSPLAKAEFVTVYGGLQAGLGLAILAASLIPRYIEASLFFAAIFSSILALFRLVSCLLFGAADALLVMLLIEVLIAAVLFIGWFKMRHG